MKKIYITPRVVVTKCMVESFIAATIGGGDSQYGPDKKPKKDPITPTDPEEEVDLHSKQFTAWDVWDED